VWFVSLDKKQHCLVVGQGLCGSWLAYRLKKAGYNVTIADPGEQNASSVSGGLINPITGLRWVCNPKILTFINSAKLAYAEVEHDLGISVWEPRDIIRIYKNEQDREFAHKRLNDPVYKNLIEEKSCPNIEAPLGYAVISKGGIVRVPTFLNAVRLAFQKNFLPYAINPKDLKIQSDGIHFQKKCYAHVFFCQGHSIINNPFFEETNIIPTPGTILNLQTYAAKALQKFILISEGHWIIATDESTCRVGATYDNIGPEKSQAQRIDQLLGSFKKAFPQAEIKKMVLEKGVRSSTIDQKPVILKSKHDPRIWAASGLSSRGSVYAPEVSALIIEKLAQA
jgi:glycine/D-amino acid oxidase-like deaminating enzyme